MKVEAYKSSNGKLFNTALEAEVENKKSDLMETLAFVRNPYYNMGYFPNQIAEAILAHKDEVVKILMR